MAKDSLNKPHLLRWLSPILAIVIVGCTTLPNDHPVPTDAADGNGQNPGICERHGVPLKSKVAYRPENNVEISPTHDHVRFMSKNADLFPNITPWYAGDRPTSSGASETVVEYCETCDREYNSLYTAYRGRPEWLKELEWRQSLGKR